MGNPNRERTSADMVNNALVVVSVSLGVVSVALYVSDFVKRVRLIKKQRSS